MNLLPPSNLTLSNVSQIKQEPNECNVAWTAIEILFFNIQLQFALYSLCSHCTKLMKYRKFLYSLQVTTHEYVDFEYYTKTDFLLSKTSWVDFEECLWLESTENLCCNNLVVEYTGRSLIWSIAGGSAKSVEGVWYESVVEHPFETSMWKGLEVEAWTCPNMNCPGPLGCLPSKKLRNDSL